MGRRAAGLIVIVTSFAFAILGLATGCGVPRGDNSAGYPGQPAPGTADFAEYAERCLGSTKSWSKAQLVFDPEMTMKQQRSSTVRARLSLDRDIEPDAVMPGAHASAVPVRVSCEAEATISVDSAAFDVTPSEWITQSVFEGQDAEWQWVVTPKDVGTYDISLRFRPVVLVDERVVDLGSRAPGNRIKVRPLEVPATMTVHVKHRTFMEAATD